MSLFDGIVNAARSVLGFPPSNDGDAKPAARTEAPARGANLAADTPTAFERPRTTSRTNTSTSAGTSTGGGPTLSERLRSTGATLNTPNATSRAPKTSDLPPHLTGGRDTAPPSRPPTASATRRGTARADVTDAGSGKRLGTVDTLAPASGDAAVAARNVQTGLDYFARTHGRDGVDGAGSGVKVLINDRSTDASGAERFAGNGGYYATTWSNGAVTEAIHFGTGISYDTNDGRRISQHAMLHADDLAIHELTHGIIRAETGHLGGEADEAGATNEGIADVMAAAATRDWRIGEGMYADDSDYRLMRNIAQPDDPTAIHGLWTHISDVRRQQQTEGEAEEHYASGVISTAAYRMQQRFGDEAGWGVVERVFYDAINSGRLGDMSFTSVAAGLRNASVAVYGQGSQAARVVDEELRRAGL